MQELDLDERRVGKRALGCELIDEAAKGVVQAEDGSGDSGLVGLSVGRADEVVDVERSYGDAGQLPVTYDEHHRCSAREAAEHGSCSGPRVDLG